MKNPLITVVIPTYNRKEFLKQTLVRFIDQSCQEYELIVVDDGSSDGTEEMIKELNFPRLRYFYKKNEERAIARNFGAEKAKGKYLIFFDSDDLAKSNFIESITDFIKVNNPDIFYVKNSWITSSGDVLRTFSFSKEQISKELIKGNFLSCSPVVIRKGVFDQFKFNEDPNLIGSEDYELWFKVAAHTTILYCDSGILNCLDHSTRSVRIMPLEQIIRRKESFFIHAFNDIQVDEKFGSYKKKMIAESYLYISLHAALVGKRGISIRYIIKAFVLKPSSLLGRKFLGISKRLFFKEKLE